MSDLEKIWDALDATRNRLTLTESQIEALEKMLGGMSNGCSLAQQNLTQIAELRKLIDERFINGWNEIANKYNAMVDEINKLKNK